MTRITRVARPMVAAAARTRAHQTRQQFRRLKSDVAPLGQLANEEPTPQQVLQRLKDGNERFVSGAVTLRDWPEEVQTANQGKIARALIHACMDSRVNPRLKFDLGLGDAFVTSVAGNIYSKQTQESIEVGVQKGVRAVVVLGHYDCAAIGLACDHRDEHGEAAEVIKELMPAVEAVRPNPEDACDNEAKRKITEENARMVAEKLVNNSEFLQARIEEDQLAVVPAVYDPATGLVTFQQPY